MKIKLFLLLTFVLGLFLTSCDKDVENSSLHINLDKKMTIKGYVYAELNKQRQGKETAPEGTQIMLSIPYSDFNPAAGNGIWSDTVTVSTDGSFTAEIPVDEDGVNLTCTPVPFEYAQRTSFSSYETTEKRLYWANPVIYALSTTHNEILEIIYNDKALAGNVYKTKINLTIQAELDESISGSEPVANQELTIYNDNFAQKVTTDENGKVSVEIPYNENVYLWISFEYNKNVYNGTEYEKKKYEYELKGSNLGAYTSETDFSINLGTGTEVK